MRCQSLGAIDGFDTFWVVDTGLVSDRIQIRTDPICRRPQQQWRVYRRPVVGSRQTVPLPRSRPSTRVPLQGACLFGAPRLARTGISILCEGLTASFQ